MRALVAAMVLHGCYTAPTPACGFLCGPAGACPQSYTCNANDGYCHLDGTPAEVSCLPEAGVDAFDFFPRIVEEVPADGAVDVALDVIATAKFTEQITGISEQTFTLVPQGGSTPLVAVVSYDPATRTATLDAVDLLATSTVYVATLSAIADVAGQPLAGETSWSFTTIADTTPPSVTVAPAAGSVGVSVDVTLVATFDELVLNANNATFLLEDPIGAIPGTIGFVSKTAVRLTPSRHLTPHTLHTATLTSAIIDLAGNPLGGAPVTWTFTTGADEIAPLVISRVPENDDIDVPVGTDPSARFSEEVVGVSPASMTLEDSTGPLAATVTYVDSTRIARLTPAAPLAPSTTYTVTLSAAIADGAGNVLAGAPVRWSFTTAVSR